MSFDPNKEDYQRLGLRYARTLDPSDPFATARAFATFSRRFSQSRDSLPQSDGDRAFHLVTKATDLIDYQLPFAPDEECGPIMDEAARVLEEAIDLDPSCHDAVRMRAAADYGSFEGYYQYLSKGADAVRQDCVARHDEALANGHDEGRVLEAELAMMPYVRWMSTLAAKALICGHYTRCLSICLDLIGDDPSDPSDVRFTGALACAKLEDASALDRLGSLSHAAARHDDSEDGWLLLARIALAHKSHDLELARELVSRCLSAYPHAGITLSRQDELPDGVFARLAVPAFSEDELIIAVSEATVVLEEGRDSSDLGSLGSWIAHEPAVVASCEQDPESSALVSLDTGRN
ncbi:MAG: response regulator receiver protein [Atopobiaceae bacterium]|jgi:hypothetical protein|nr:response regulator receiver protein [Atopobiaceae bacterium]MCI2173876.1 response regulator receiver protein [Atopobiaceae bacterium]MCI2208034.1 response regulator receiver protein [Atopobiaceae bacterium]